MTGQQTFRIAVVVAIGVATCVLSGQASATEPSWDNALVLGAAAVRERNHPEYQPDGLRVGNFRLYPEIGFGTSWNGEGYSGIAGTGGDFRHELSTRIVVKSDLPRHFLNIEASGRAVQYQEHEEIQYLDGGINGRWRIDIDHATSIYGGGGVALGHSENVDVERPLGASRPPGILSSNAEIGLRRSGGRIDAAVGIRYERFEYSDVKANDGSMIALGWQNYSVLKPYAELGWRISPGYRLFGDIEGRKQENVGTPLVDRDAYGMSAHAGVQFELSTLVRVSLKGGFFQQDYRQAGLLDIAEPVWEGRLEWLVTPLVTLSLATMRDVRATSFGMAAGRRVTAHSVRAEYEMWRNLHISVDGALEDIDYIGDTRRDTALIAGAGLTYAYNKHWLASLRYEHQELTSNVAAYDRRLDKVGISLKYRF